VRRVPEQIFVHRNIAKYVAQEHLLILLCARLSEVLTAAIRPCVIPLLHSCTVNHDRSVTDRYLSQFHLTDNNAVSVLTYGVTGIKDNPIREVQVVGHTNCAGVDACHKAVRGTNVFPPDSVLWAWLGPLVELARLKRNDPETVDELAVRNVRAQIQNVKVVLSRLGRQSSVQVKGYIYNIMNGRLEPVSELI